VVGRSLVGYLNAMTLGDEPRSIDPPEPAVVDVPERVLPEEVPEPAIEDPPDRG
jgi:hypothetical protein